MASTQYQSQVNRAELNTNREKSLYLHPARPQCLNPLTKSLSAITKHATSSDYYWDTYVIGPLRRLLNAGQSASLNDCVTGHQLFALRWQVVSFSRFIYWPTYIPLIVIRAVNTGVAASRYVDGRQRLLPNAINRSKQINKAQQSPCC